MRHADRYERLTSPELSPNAAFCHISYALFRVDDDFGRVIAARFPAASVLTVGDELQSRLHLSDEAVADMLGTAGRQVPLFCLSDAGLGMLCHFYVREAGIGLYLHIHCRPEAGARLLCSGALGTPSGRRFRLTQRIRDAAGSLKHADTESFEPLLDAWRAVESARASLFVTHDLDGGGREACFRASGTVVQSVARIADVVERMADFVGCSVNCRIPVDAYERAQPVALYRPRLLEVLILYILTEVRTHAADRLATVEIHAVEHPRSFFDRRLALSFAYPIDTLHMPLRERERLIDIRQSLTDMATHAGLDLSFPPPMPPDLHASDARRADPDMFRQIVSLEWLTDPSVLPLSDLKVPVGFDWPEEPGD